MVIENSGYLGYIYGDLYIVHYLLLYNPQRILPLRENPGTHLITNRRGKQIVTGKTISW